MQLTLGSLFDGISGFPLAGARLGITTKWGSEIEAFPIKVSEIRFPDMKQLGDITKINGAELEPVDIVTGGSPCQDLSVAGKRAGLAGERSGLFMEQIRIVREMRERDRKTGKPIRPRFMVWENVPGAFSSNKDEDFRAVLEETARIADETVTIPRPPRGKWDTCGAIVADRWSIAWRVLDAQYWGVPQRRRRIFLVADFGGQSAPEILFKRQGLQRHIAQGEEAGEGVAANAEGGVGKAIPINTQIATRGNRLGERTGFGIGNEGDPAYTIQEAHSHAVAIDSNCQDSRFKLTGQVVAVRTANTGANGQAVAVINCQPSGIAGTVSSKWAKGTGGPAGDEHYNLVVDEVAKPLSAQPQLRHREDMDTLITQHYSVRRLTPLECERLQDFPDGWTDIPGASDSARYKALGNSLAVVCAEYVLEGIKSII